MEERQTNYTLMEGYELPSRGKIYDVPVDSHVELRSMTARDEMKRLAPSTTPLKTLADIIEGCMIEKPKIHVYDMALGDYEYLLHKVRVVTYGENYKITTRCPECGETIETVAKLNSLDVKEFDEDAFNALREFTLPASGKRVTLNFLTPRLVELMDTRAKELQRKYKSANIDFDTMTRLEVSINTIDGQKLGPTDLDSLVNSLPSKDLVKILNSIDKLNQYIGLDNQLFLTCPKCQNEFINFFRFGPEFFRPTDI